MTAAATARYSLLLGDPSIEITGKDTSAFVLSAPMLRPGTAVNVTYLGGEDAAARLKACQAIVDHGFRPVPHISARRLNSDDELRTVLASLQAARASSELFIVGGDPTVPQGPFSDALSLIDTGLLPHFGVRRIGIAGYPEGHPHISSPVLWAALENKVAAAQDQSLSASITTQFGFDARTVVDWITAVRERGIDVPVRIGIPGPASVRRLMGYARRFGVKSSAGVVSKYGISLASLVGSAGPDRFMNDLDRMLTPGLGRVSVHFYTFGDLGATASWISARTAARP